MKILKAADLFYPGKFPVEVKQIPYVNHPHESEHIHEFSELFLIFSGKATHCCNGKSVPVQMEDVLLIHPGASHYFKDCEGLDAISMMYDPAFPYLPLLSSKLDFVHEIYPETPQASRNQAEPILKVPQSDFGFMSSILLRLHYEVKYHRLGHDLIAQSLFAEIITYLARGYSKLRGQEIDWRINKAVAYMNKHYRKKITIREISRNSGISERALFLKFMEAFQVSPYKYLIQIRLFHAAKLLQDKSVSILEIALRTGFYDSNHFCKVFRQHYGKPPNQFRQ